MLRLYASPEVSANLKGILSLLVAIGGSGAPSAVEAGAAPMTLEEKIPLGDIKGRIDHLAFDPVRRRVYVAELGNNSVGIVDMRTRQLIRTVSGFDEPQGIEYEPSTDTIYVANAGDGSVRVFSGEDSQLSAGLPLLMTRTTCVSTSLRVVLRGIRQRSARHH